MVSNYPVSCPHSGCNWAGNLTPSLLRGVAASEAASLQRAWFRCPRCEGYWEVRITDDTVSVLPAGDDRKANLNAQRHGGLRRADVTEKVLAVLLAGGSGTRLAPLTLHRAKPAVPFGGAYRVVDFALSNCLNSRLFNVLVLPQYKSLSLERHISLGWSRFFHAEFGQRLDVASPQQRVDGDWYTGTANAVYQNIYSIKGSGAESVLVLAADHVYKMDYRRLLAFHRCHGGMATVAAVRCPTAQAAGKFGVVEVGGDWRVRGFQEKPEAPAETPGRPGTCLASMGVYVFDARFLIDGLEGNAALADPGRDFGYHILPKLIGQEQVYAFEHGGQGGLGAYWRDVGTIDAYFEANMDLLCDAPELDLYDSAWPVYSVQPSLPPPRVALTPAPGRGGPGVPRPSIVANGARSSGWLSGAVVGFNCRIDSGAAVEGSILFDGVVVGRGAEIRGAILDRAVEALPGARIGLDADEDRRRGFTVSEGGVTCVPRGAVVGGPG